MKKRNLCVGLSPRENITYCITSRPPLVLFTVGLCVLAGAMISLAVYVRDTQVIQNPTYKTDWMMFLNDLSSITWSTNPKCVKHFFALPKRPANITDQVSIIVYANLSGQFHIDYGKTYRALVWKDKLLPKEKLKKHSFGTMLSFSLLVPETAEAAGKMAWTADKRSANKNSANEGLTPLCMDISTDHLFLASGLKKPELCNPYKPQADKTKTIFACDKHKPHNSFTTAHVEKDDPSYKMHLTDDERENIHLHLMSTGYFLFMMVVAVLVYGLLKRRGHIQTNTEAGAQLLPAANSSTA